MLREIDTLELATSDDERVAASGAGEPIETDALAVARALTALAVAAARYGPVPLVTWTVEGRTLALAPVTAEAAPVVLGEEVRDLGALVARSVIEELGGSLELADQTLTVRL